MKWLLCMGDEEWDEAVLFLLSHRHELGLPYAFETVVGSLCMAAEQGGMLICREENGAIVAALAYTSGTAEGEYDDVWNMELLFAFVLKERRGSGLFGQGMERLAHQAMESRTGEIWFYAPPKAEFRELLGQYAERCETVHKACGPLDLYVIAALELPERIAAAKGQGG